MTSTIQTRVYEVRNSKYSSSDGCFIDCEYNHPVYGWIPFTASPDDVEELGRTIFQHITESGDLVVAPYTPPTDEELAVEVRAKRDSLLVRFDMELYRNQLYWESLTQEQRDERLAYRQALLDVPEQEGFPYTVVWPDFPTL